MATAKANRKTAAIAVELPECPVCFETMTAPIFLCQSGHSLCNGCTSRLLPPICPLCRQAMTQMRSWQLEEVISKARVPCPNKSDGCVYTMVNMDVNEHLKECIFRQMDCPLGAVFGRCSWKGKLANMMDHFKDRHPAESNVGPDTEIEIKDVNIRNDDRYVYMVSQTKLFFIITFKIDTLQKMAYWAIQHIGSKKVAQQHIYEIHVISKKDPRRKVVFSEHCFNDTLKADEVFRQSKCAMLPVEALEHFVKDRKLSFRFFIKRIPGPTKNKEDDKNGNKGPKGPGPKGPSSNIGKPNYSKTLGSKKFYKPQGN